MKLASLRNERDGQLLVVSQDLSRALKAPKEVRNLQYALDHWNDVKDLLSRLYQELNRSKTLGEKLDFEKLASPLPRAYEWIDGSSFINHVILVRKARGAEPPETLYSDPLIYQGGSGVLLGPREPIRLANSEWGCDFESEVCVVLGDTPQGTKAEDAHKYIRLVMLANDVSLRNLIPAELAKNFGFFQSKPATAFSPVALTPEELGQHWKEGRLHLPLITRLNGKIFGQPNAGPEMHFSFFDLIEHICLTRSYTAGTILGSGTVSNKDRAVGSSCLAEQRMLEKIENNSITTPFLKYGDIVSIEMHDAKGQSLFGEIKQEVLPFC